MNSAANSDKGTNRGLSASRSHALRRNVSRYGLALGSVAGATGLGFLANDVGLHDSVFAVFLLAIALTSWHAGVGPAITAFLLSAFVFDYIFTPPLHAISFTRQDIAHFFAFALFSSLLISFGLVRRKAEDELRESRDELEGKVAERTADLQGTNKQLQQEVAERRRLGDILRERASLLDLTHDMIFVRDMNSIITYWNRGAEEFYGWKAEEVVGKFTTHQILHTIFPVPLDEITAQLIRTDHWDGELIHTKRDGTKAVVASRWSMLRNEQGQPIAALETNNDITEGKRAEEALARQANLLEQTHDAIFVWEFPGTITYWNRGAEQLYGFSHQDALGRLSHELLHTIHPLSIPLFEETLERDGQWVGELTQTTRDGRQIIVESRHVLMRQPDGPRLVLETNRDITERKRAEEALRQSRDDLEIKVKERTVELRKTNDDLQSVNKELEAFAYSVSHDLRAPVRHIAGFTELLQKQSEAVLDEKSQHHIDMILDSAKRMGNLVDDLLAFSRIGRAETQKTTIHLEKLIKSVVAEIAPDTQDRKLVWRIGSLPICHGDPSMLRLVFANLVSNAVKFTRTREEAEIQIDSLNHNPDEVVVFVKDNGVGFDMKYSDKLFGVFQRLHSQEAFEGTGIGLATVQRIVHRHGGRVWAEGSIDKGAAFYVALPKPGDIKT